MPATIAVTGGVGCGKSYCVRGLVARLGDEGATGRSVAHFNCDEAVADLLTEGDIIAQLENAVGCPLRLESGEFDRAKLREIIFAEDDENRRIVEGILHPHVLKRAEAFLTNSVDFTFRLLEVPLLYEVEFPIKRDLDLVVGCSRSTQVSRLVEFRGLSTAEANKIIDSQIPVLNKTDQGELLIWNDGSLQSCNQQLQKLSQFIHSNSGI